MDILLFVFGSILVASGIGTLIILFMLWLIHTAMNRFRDVF